MERQYWEFLFTGNQWNFSFPEKDNLEWIELIKATFKWCNTLRRFLYIMIVLEWSGPREWTTMWRSFIFSIFKPSHGKWNFDNLHSQNVHFKDNISIKNTAVIPRKARSRCHVKHIICIFIKDGYWWYYIRQSQEKRGFLAQEQDRHCKLHASTSKGLNQVTFYHNTSFRLEMKISIASPKRLLIPDKPPQQHMRQKEHCR